MNFKNLDLKMPIDAGPVLRSFSQSLALAIWSFSGASSFGVGSPPANLQVDILPRFNGTPLVFDAVTNVTAADQLISVTRLDFLLSDFALRRGDGSWLSLTNSQAYVSAREGRTGFPLPPITAGRYNALRFLVGLTADVNKSDPALYPPGHPLNPNVNGLHWGWQGGYVFLALEGNWRQGPKTSGYSFHIANDPQLMTIELPVDLELISNHSLRIILDVGQIFSGAHTVTIAETNSATHSRPNDALAAQLHRNIERAFTAESLVPVRIAGARPATVKALVAANATPYRLTISASFPRPALPLDNPLTEEGVELGRLLFNDKQLSGNSSQSCASCHNLSAAGTDPTRAQSIGADGQAGARNAMALFNLAWKDSFFWDGRSATLREQVLQPVQNPIEMHESLTNLVAKLRSNSPQASSEAPLQHTNASLLRSASASNTDYPTRFARAFGTAEITADRIARALEQFLLVQVSHNSKFDHVLAGTATFTEQEQRGFELFHTEYDPRREQFGADCFHCHGGPLFQSQAFANNGLDSDFADVGRFVVTGKDGDRGKFAVPSLRNVEVTPPYMHDGRFNSLEDVIEHYSTGIRRSASLDPNLAKHPDGGIHLNDQDQLALVAFLRTLTDEKFEKPCQTIASAP